MRRVFAFGFGFHSLALSFPFQFLIFSILHAVGISTDLFGKIDGEQVGNVVGYLINFLCVRIEGR